MKLLLKIHNKERHSPTVAASTAVTLFQRKRKYYHRRVSNSSSYPLPANNSAPASSHASSLLASPSSSSSSSSPSSATGASASAPLSPSGANSPAQSMHAYEGESSLTIGGSASPFSNYRESSSCPIERRPLLRNSQFQSSGRSFASVSRSGRNNQNRGLPSNEPTTLRQERYFIYGALIFFAIVGFSTAIYFIVNQAQSADGMKQPRDILFGENYNPRTIPTLGNSHMIIDRNNWGTQDDVQAPVRLERPVPYVLVTHVGAKNKNCTDIYQCSNKMRILQDAAIGERYLPDIPSNFYIGGDGNIYVGRGWDIANSYHNRTISICFMGDYNVYAPLESQLSALQHLLTYGVVKDVLSKDFRLVARRQTKNTTKSPGDQLYPRIVQLSRWNPCGTQSYMHCGAELGFPSLWDDEKLYNERNGRVNPLISQRKEEE
ncbi:peptidoglycan-recognition protein LA-like [Anopheles ziemanni]|uniref:peptidoglycan-recognition protein LA-like n=1 Tax=Anopheles coustani TaxID=139045 RepID=UPI00265AC4B0|nr:peptidoglycan-recognition protein LA-like [Anopheles coustani]XP_058166268.1 peptidoglycan-recognition protein LA-like [Anopheles ziemanni]